MTSVSISWATRWCGRLAVSAVAAFGTTVPLIALLGSTDGHSVRWFGWPFPLRCAFSERFGQPCGSCGLTRSWILTAHGSFQDAQQLHAHGPATFFATLLTGLVALGVMFAVRAAWLSRRGGAALVGTSIAVLACSFAPIVSRNRELQRTVTGDRWSHTDDLTSATPRVPPPSP